jgi:hypothetical protein
MHLHLGAVHRSLIQNQSVVPNSQTSYRVFIARMNFPAARSTSITKGVPAGPRN